jgi:hypothetical protein
MKYRITAIVAIIAIIIIGVMSGCTAREETNQGASRLIVLAITGTDLSGALDSNVIYSDVLTTSGSVYDDLCAADLRVEPLYPYQTTVSYTWYQDVMVDQIDIEYSRADGLNVQGVDVPYSFSQKIYERVKIGELTQINFVIVTHNAKAESPLIELVNYGQEHVLKLEAKITFHAVDLAGNRVEPVVGGVSVWCCNFADDK